MWPADPDSGIDPSDSANSGTPTVADLSLAEIVHTRKDAAAGASVATGGDFDGDGHLDLVLGSPGQSESGTASGAVHVAFGPFGGTHILEDVAVTLDGRSDLDEFGLSVAGFGDVNGDGLGDVGAVGGVVAVMCGNSDRSVSFESVCWTIEGAGSWTMTLAGDANGNGHTDMFVGEKYGSAGAPAGGMAYLFTGPPVDQQSHEDAHATLINPNAYEYAGYSVASGRDVNGDGYVDFLMGAPSDTHNGITGGLVYYFSGPITGTISTADATATYDGEVGEGMHLDFAEDLESDGYADILIGSYLRQEDRNEVVYIYSGIADGPDLACGRAHAAITDTGFDGSYQFSPTSVGDLDGDGAGDILVSTNRGFDRPMVYAFHGPIWGTHTLEGADASLLAPNPGARGWAVSAPAGDLDGDGLPDVIVGDRDLEYEDLRDAGGAFLISGSIL